MNRREFLAATLGTAAGLALCPANARAAKKMNILVLTGSPRKNGNSAHLADKFIAGAETAGHSVSRFDAGLHPVNPCMACNACGMNGPCVQHDAFEPLRDLIIGADLVAFVSPVYYYGISSQLKAVIDRFYAINGSIHVAKKAVLMLTLANHETKRIEPIQGYYEALLDYLGWTDAGRVIAQGVWTAGEVKSTEYPAQAYALGLNLA